MFNANLIVVSVFSVIVLKCAASESTDCFEYKNGTLSYNGTTNVTHTGKICQRWDSQYPHEHGYILSSEHRNYCRSTEKYGKLWCYTMTITRWEDCDIPECANGEWSMWSDWRFCEVNCVREDTIEGKQRRWRTCKGSECSGNNMEERACSDQGICKGMRSRKLLCKCPKRLIKTKWHFLDGMNITDAEVKEMVLEDFNQNVKSKISIDKKTVSKEVRKKNSSVNKRRSAQSIGWGCIVFLILPMVFLIAIDILNCCIHFRTRCGRRKRNRTRSFSVIRDHADSAKPLQENVVITEEYYAGRRSNNFQPDEMKQQTYQRRREEQHSRMEWKQYI